MVELFFILIVNGLYFQLDMTDEELFFNTMEECNYVGSQVANELKGWADSRETTFTWLCQEKEKGNDNYSS